MSTAESGLAALFASNRDAVALAEAVSIAVRIEPQLLRRMRLTLFPGADASAEADLWFSPLVESRTPGGIVLEAEAARLLRRRLAAEPALLQAAWRVVESLHRDVSPALLAEERLTYQALAGEHEGMRATLRTAVATLLSPRREGIAGWAARALERLPEAVRSAEEGQMLAFGASLRLGEAAPLDETLPSARAAAWASWLAPSGIPLVGFGVTLLEGGIEFGPPGQPGSHRLELPHTTPVVVELGWQQDGEPRTQRCTLHPGVTRHFETAADADRIEIRTVLGETFRLARAEAPPPDEERVRLTYEADLGGWTETRELAYVVGVLADFAGHPAEPLPPFRERRFAPITAETFDAVLASLRPRVAFGASWALGGDDGEDELPVDLRFLSLGDFHPAAVARQVPQLARLLEARTRLAELHGHLSQTGADELKHWLNECLTQLHSGRPLDETEAFRVAVSVLARGAREPEALVRSFVEQVAPPFSRLDPRRAGEAAAQEAQQKVQQKVQAQTFEWRPARLGAPEEVPELVRARLTEIDRLLSAQLSHILHHPDFQRLEATWRGLAHLVSQTPTSPLLKIKVLSAGRDELQRDLQRAHDFRHSYLFRKVYEEEFGSFGGEPLGVLVGGYEFGRSAADLDLLRAIAGIAATAHAPFLASASPDLLAIRSFAELNTGFGDRPPRGAGPAELHGFDDLRASEDARYLGLTVPRVLLRVPYGRTTTPVEEFDFEEIVDGTDHDVYLWGSATWALAARITAAVARYGWCARIRGVESGGVVEGLPLHTFETDRGELATRGPAEIAIGERREQELVELGFIPLSQLRGTDSAAFLTTPTVASGAGGRAARHARAGHELPYVLAVSRFVQYLYCIVRDNIGGYRSRSETEQMLNHWLGRYVVDRSVEVGAKGPLREGRVDLHEPAGERPGTYQAVAYLLPRYQLPELGAPIRIEFELPAPPA